MKSRKNSFQENYVENVIVIHLILMSCKNMLVSTSEVINMFNLELNLLIAGILIVLYAGIFVFSPVINKFRPEIIIILVSIFAFITISSLLEPNLIFGKVFPYTYVKKQIYTFIEYSLPLFFSSACVNNPNYLEVKLFKSVYVMFAFATIAVLLFKSVGNNLNEYSMAYGNAVLLNGMLLLFKYKKEKNKLDILLFFITIGYVLMAGSRGPLLCYAAAFVLVILDKYSIRDKILICLLGIPLLIFVFLFREPILYSLYSALLKIGFNSRSLFMFAEGNYLYDGGRSELHQQIFAQLQNHPLIGLGALGGGKVVGLPHGVYVDILANFGYIFGIVYMILMAMLSYKILRKHNGKFRNIYMMFFIMAFVRGFYEESFWTSKELWILMGMIISNKYCIINDEEEIDFESTVNAGSLNINRF